MKYLLFIFCLTSTFLSAQNTLTKVSGEDCNIKVYGELLEIPEEDLTAVECFEIGKCEFSGGHLSESYRFLELAETKGFEDERLLEFYKKEVLLAIGQREVLDAGPQALQQSAGVDKTNHDHMTVEVETYLNHMLEIDLLNRFFLVCGFLVLIMAGFILYRFGNRNPAIWFFAFFLFCISQFIIEWDLHWSRNFGYFFEDPLYRVIFYLWGPVFYLYIRRSFYPDYDFRWLKRDVLVHGFVFFAVFLVLLACNISPEVDALNWPHAIIKSIFLKSVHIVVYYILTLRLLYKNFYTLGNVHQRWFTTLLFFFTMMSFAMAYVFIFEYDYSTLYESRLFFALTFSVLGLFVLGSYLIQPRVFLCSVLRVLDTTSATPDPDHTTGIQNSGDQYEKYKNSGLTDSLVQKLRSDLLMLMEDEKLFKDPDLSLSTLSKSLNSDRYSVSQVINQEFGKSFYEFLNDYRVEEVIRIMELNGNKLKLVDMAFQAGFNNRVSFNKAFKARKGVTPSAFLRQLNHVA